ncbi:GDP-L-fucose synthase [Sphingomonas aerolata]|jgi:GDP-L-fucose synthase|uniref:GDP-L-fucose synthase n=1 Tax=Sphingomonas aerolata TaxID=185951 RepID=UPI002FE18CD8
MPIEPTYPLAGKRIWVAGQRGMVGAAVVRRLAGLGCAIIPDRSPRLDLRRQADVEAWLEEVRPDAIVIAAARVGGILANDSYPVDFLEDNLLIQTNIIGTAHRIGVERLLFLGSSCIYPRMADQPITEAALLTGQLEETNQWYAIAKIAGIKLVQAYRRQHGRDYISAMPTNLYGPGDNFDFNSSHVLPALIRKAHDAKASGAESMTVWGSGTPRREFMHVDDCADALVFLLQNYSDAEHVNVGTGDDIAIRDLAGLVSKVVGFDGGIVLDSSRPDGTPRKLLSNEKLARLGWTPKVALEDGIRSTYRWFLEQPSIRALA